MSLDVLNTPWECDDIVFLPGDWEIGRASEEGKYQYSVSGIVSRNLATADDLVKWKMAKNLSLDLLMPWDNDGITLVDGVSILRDFLNSSGREKYYLLNDRSSSTMLLRVNKYYLIKEKYAIASDELKQTIAKKKVKSKKYNRFCEPWPDDDIFILDPAAGETIARGTSIGSYRVTKSSGSIVNWRADVLISEGKAIAGCDIRLEEMASCESVSLQEYYDATRGFWLSVVGGVPTFSQIAHIWCSLQNNPNGAIASALLSELNGAIAVSKSFDDKFAEFNAKANKLDDEIKRVQPQVIELENIYEGCKLFQNKTILDDFTPFSRLSERFTAAKNEIDIAYGKISNLFVEVKKALQLIKRDVSQIKDVRFFPHNVLPNECAAYFQEKEKEYQSAMRELQDFSPYDLRIEDLNANIELLKSVIEQTDISDIESYVEKKTTRKATLDSLREVISGDDKFRKKPGLFAKPNKEDGIKYITGIQIKSKVADNYTVTYSAGSIEVSALELIYLGLAERA